MLPYKSSFLALTMKKGMFRYTGSEFVTFETQIDKFLTENTVYHGAKIRDSTYVIGTLDAGIIVIDQKGNKICHIDKSKGLGNNKAHYIYPDNQNGVWVALDIGLARLELPSVFSQYDSSYGLEGIVVSVVKHNGQIYAGTTAGLYVLDDKGSNRFSLVSNFTNQCWSLLSVGEDLMMATNLGVFQIRNEKITQLSEDFSYVLHRTDNEPNRLFVGMLSGIASISLTKNKRWTLGNKIDGIDEEIRSISEDNQGNLWLSTRRKEAIKISISNRKPTEYKVEKIIKNKEKSDNKIDYVFSMYGHVKFATSKGLLAYNEKKKKFFSDSLFSHDTTAWYFRAVGDYDGLLWVYSNDKLKVLGKNRMKNEKISKINRFLHRMPIGIIEVIYPLPEGEVWLGGEFGLIRVDGNFNKHFNKKFNTVIRSVRVGSNYEIFGGHGGLVNTSIVPYDSSQIRFRYAATSYDNSMGNLYSYILDGYDTYWSKWTYESTKDYTNLSSGNYTFRVKSKNIYGIVSKEDSYEFIITTPWYATWWALVGYVCFLLQVMYLLVKWRLATLKNEKEQLATKVAEQTVELTKKNEHLLQVDNLKSNFYLNISHELRTPLTLILNPLLNLYNQNEREIPQKQLLSVIQNAHRLERLVDQIIDISKLEKGKQQLFTQEREVIMFVKGIVMSFETLAYHKGINLEIVTSQPSIIIYYDSDKLEKIIYNLMSNAVKFTDPGGKITVNVEETDDFDHGAVKITVADTGIGIHEDKIEHVFEKFYQAHPQRETVQQGIGVGLSLTKEMVSLHKGSISIKSQLGVGTKVIVLLPKGKEHLETHQIVETRNPENIAHPNFIDTDHPMTEEEIHSHKDLPKVLIVEDNYDVRALLKVQLSELYNIVEASNGQQGIEMAQLHIPDLIITDVMMPEVDGLEMTKQLKQNINTSHIPIVVLTARASTYEKTKGLEIGADEYLEKPFDTKELLARISNLIKSRNHLAYKYSQQITLEPHGVEVTSVDAEFLRKLVTVVENNISNSDFSVETLSEHMAMSRTHLHRKLIAITQLSASQVIRAIRIKHAAHLIQNEQDNIAQIAYSVGFNNISYFTKCFKEEFGVTPSDYRKK